MQLKIFREKFKLFRLIDFLMPGSLGPISTAGAIWVATKDVSLQAKLLMFTVSLFMWLIYGVVLKDRYQYLKKISFITSDNIAFFTNGFDVQQIAVEGIIKTTLSQWQDATKWSGTIDSVGGSTVTYVPYPIVDGEKKYAGTTRGNNITVAFKSPNVKLTSLSHELGHVVHENWTGIADNDACHKYMAEHNLP